MAMDLSANYTLGADIDMSELTKASGMWNTSTGFAPVGSFTGTFDGQGHTVTGLYINRPATDNVGLFGTVSESASIQNIKLVNNFISGRDYTGTAVGYIQSTDPGAGTPVLVQNVGAG